MAFRRNPFSVWGQFLQSFIITRAYIVSLVALPLVYNSTLPKFLLHFHISSTYLSNFNFLTGLILANPLEDNSQGSQFASGAGDFIGTLGDLAKQGLTKISEATGMIYIEWSQVTSFLSLFNKNVQQLTRLT